VPLTATCHHCGHDRLNPTAMTLDDTTQRCPHGCCFLDCCAACGRGLSSWGPVACKCDDFEAIK
jgi:hypothetical protein